MGPESKSKYTKLVEEKIASGEIHLKNLEEARNTSESKMTSRYDTQREGFAMEANLQLFSTYLVLICSLWVGISEKME